jgi:hypothetical protein
MSNRGRRALVRDVTKNLMVTSSCSRVSLWRFDNLPEGQPSLQHSSNQAFMVVTRQMPLQSKRHMTAGMEFAKRYLKSLKQ